MLFEYVKLRVVENLSIKRYVDSTNYYGKNLDKYYNALNKCQVLTSFVSSCKLKAINILQQIFLKILK